MKNMTPAKMAELCGGRLTGPADGYQKEMEAVVTDSRKVTSGSLFVAIRGEKTDGHAYIPQAVEAGAACILAESLPEGLCVPGIQVADPAKALQPIAAYYREQIGIPVVGIIGSSGKTSTKEMVAAVLGERFRVCKTEGNFNNELGVPLTIFRMRDSDQFAVIEMGINHFGEMDRLGKMVRPDAVVMTNIGTAHLEYLESREGILKAKSEVFAHMADDSTVILNGDDDMLSGIREVNGKAPVRFAIESEEADIRATDIMTDGLAGMRFRLHTPTTQAEIRIPTPGMHAVYNALAGAAVGELFGLSADEIARGILAYQGLPGRMQIRTKDGRTILDDCYNANPASMKASLDTLRLANGRKVAVLGDMGELGDEEEALHRDIGRVAAEGGVDVLVTVGERSRWIREGALEKDPDMEEIHFETAEECCQELPERILPGDTVLVKASHFMGLETVVDALMA